MRLSHSGINRICEEKAAADPEYDRQFRRGGRGFLGDGRKLSDEELIAKLATFGYVIDRASFAARADGFLSAQAMATEFLEQFEHDHWGANEDWVWITLTCLWERWLLDRPSMEMIDDWMQAGYKSLEAKDRAAACRHWLRTWKRIWRVIQELQLRTIDAFDDLFCGTQSFFNWVQDFSAELQNAGNDDPSFLAERIAVLETLLNHLDLPDAIRQNAQRDLADSYFAKGDAAHSEQLYRDWLAREPTWGFGWMGWSDCYDFWPPKDQRDLARSESILQQGLAVEGVDDREYLLERLADLYDETGRRHEAQALREQAERLRNPPPPPSRAALAKLTGSQNAIRALARVGRNAPCPCGSGKKFKKCCVRRQGSDQSFATS